MARQRNHNFYTEVMVVTILSLVSSAIWIEMVKTLINRYFSNDIFILLGVAAILTLLSLFVFHHFFVEDEEKDKS